MFDKNYLKKLTLDIFNLKLKIPQQFNEQDKISLIVKLKELENIKLEYINLNEEEIRQEISKECFKWLGAKYHVLGMIQYELADCYTLLLQVYIEVGLIEPQKPKFYTPQFLFHCKDENYLEGIKEYSYPTNEYKIGNVIMYKYHLVVSHAAIIVSETNIIHEVASQGCVMDDFNQLMFKEREKAIYSFWGNN